MSMMYHMMKRLENSLFVTSLGIATMHVRQPENQSQNIDFVSARERERVKKEGPFGPSAPKPFRDSEASKPVSGALREEIMRRIKTGGRLKKDRLHVSHLDQRKSSLYSQPTYSKEKWVGSLTNAEAWSIIHE